jgi:hypothetical protein
LPEGRRPYRVCLRDLRNGWLVGRTAVARDHPSSQRQQHHDREDGGPELSEICPSMKSRLPKASCRNRAESIANPTRSGGIINCRGW